MKSTLLGKNAGPQQTPARHFKYGIQSDRSLTRISKYTLASPSGKQQVAQQVNASRLLTSSFCRTGPKNVYGELWWTIRLPHPRNCGVPKKNVCALVCQWHACLKMNCFAMVAGSSQFLMCDCCCGCGHRCAAILREMALEGLLDVMGYRKRW